MSNQNSPIEGEIRPSRCRSASAGLDQSLDNRRFTIEILKATAGLRGRGVPSLQPFEGAILAVELHPVEKSDNFRGVTLSEHLIEQWGGCLERLGLSLAAAQLVLNGGLQERGSAGGR